MSQKEKIKQHLKTYGSITPLEALNKIGCFRLSARVKELRDEGLNIKTEKVEPQNYARYRLIEKDR